VIPLNNFSNKINRKARGQGRGFLSSSTLLVGRGLEGGERENTQQKLVNTKKGAPNEKCHRVERESDPAQEGKREDPTGERERANTKRDSSLSLRQRKKTRNYNGTAREKIIMKP